MELPNDNSINYLYDDDDCDLYFYEEETDKEKDLYWEYIHLSEEFMEFLDSFQDTDEQYEKAMAYITKLASLRKQINAR